LDGRPAGRIWVARSADEIRIVDLALLPSARGGGVGTHLFQELIAEAAEASLPLRLSVRKNNHAALRLYERLGFVVVGDDDVYLQIEHRRK
jgi:ribosomal protein S18 acetylase RimI-like enzyme